MPRKLNLALVCMQVCLEGQDFWIAPARLPVEVQTSEVLNVSHPSCVHLHEILYPLGLILRALQGKWSSQFFFFFSGRDYLNGHFPHSLLRTHPKHVAPAWPSCLYWIPVRNAPTIPFSAVKSCAEQMRNVAWRGVGLTGLSNHKTKLGILCGIQPFVFLLSHRTSGRVESTAHLTWLLFCLPK